jgi:hypothetical protein
MDEISTGLDSATTHQIIKYLRHSTHALDGTTIISLLQPAPETYELFDDVILISEGQIVYQGPREYAVDFFAAMGFRCPERKNVADFLQEVSDSALSMLYLCQLGFLVYSRLLCCRCCPRKINSNTGANMITHTSLCPYQNLLMPSKHLSLVRGCTRNWIGHTIENTIIPPLFQLQVMVSRG